MVFSQQCTLQWSTDLQCVQCTPLQCTVHHRTVLYTAGVTCVRGSAVEMSEARPRPARLEQPLCAMVTPEEACQFDLHQTPTQFISFWTIYAIPVSKCPISLFIIFVCFNIFLPLILFMQFCNPCINSCVPLGHISVFLLCHPIILCILSLSSTCCPVTAPSSH